jgi:hypothetical protein
MNRFLFGALLGFTGYLVFKYCAFCRKRAIVLKDDPVVLKTSDPILDEMIVYLLQKMGEKRVLPQGIYQVPESIQAALKKDRFCLPVLQKLADSIVSHTGAHNAVEVIIKDSFKGNDISGAYEVHGKANWQVHLFRDNTYSVAQVIAVLIHECVHNFLYYYDLEVYPEIKNEVLTDVAAVFLGFGELLCQGYKPIKEITKSYLEDGELKFRVLRWKVGYLNLNEIIYLQNKYEAYTEKYTWTDMIYGLKLL